MLARGGKRILEMAGQLQRSSGGYFGFGNHISIIGKGRGYSFISMGLVVIKRLEEVVVILLVPG